MINIKKIEEEIDRLGSLKALTETYETIAASSMQRIRNLVVQNRIFHSGLSDIFQEVRRAYEKSAHMHTTSGNISLLQKKKKEVLVFLSANTGLYGDLIEKIEVLLEKEVQNHPGDLVVVGKLGARLMGEKLPKYSYRYFELSDQAVDTREIKALIEHVSQYEKVIFVHGSFKNILRQDAVVSNPLGEAKATEEPAKDTPRYLFEPTLGAVAFFFETELFASFLEQVLNESGLAKFASRLVVLDRAVQNIERVFKKSFVQKKQLIHWLSNKKQVNITTSAVIHERINRKR